LAVNLYILKVKTSAYKAILMPLETTAVNQPIAVKKAEMLALQLRHMALLVRDIAQFIFRQKNNHLPLIFFNA